MMFEKKFNGKKNFCNKFLFQNLFSSHKTATVFANDVKRNLSILEDTLGQCTNDSKTNHDGDLSELKIQSEKLMV